MNKQKLWPLLVLSIVGGSIIGFATKPYGIGLSPDSVAYISVARHLLKGQGFVGYNGVPHVEHPPLYPLLLAGISYITGVDPLRSALPVAIVLFSSVIFLSGLLFLKHLQTFPEIAILGTIAIMLATPMVQIGRMAWSEALFIFFVLLSLLLFDMYLEQGHIVLLILFAFALSLASVTRYIGLTLLLPGVSIALLRKQNTLKIKGQHTLVYLIVAGLFPALWIAHNLWATGTPFGPRVPSQYSFTQNIQITIWKIWRWYFPPGVNKIVWLSLLSILGGLGIFNAWRQWETVRKEWPTQALRLFPIILFAGSYVGALIISASLVAIDQIGARLLSPLYPLVTLLVWLGLVWSVLMLPSTETGRRNAKIILSLVLLVWLLYPAKNSWGIIQTMRTEGRGYNSPGWQHNRLVQYLQTHSDRLDTLCPTYYTNDPQAFYLFTNHFGILSPEKQLYHSSRTSSLKDIERKWPETSPACLVWFSYTHRPYLFSPDELQTIVSMKPLVHFKEGSLYLLTTLQRSDSSGKP